MQTDELMVNNRRRNVGILGVRNLRVFEVLETENGANWASGNLTPTTKHNASVVGFL